MEKTTDSQIDELKTILDSQSQLREVESTYVLFQATRRGQEYTQHLIDYLGENLFFPDGRPEGSLLIVRKELV